MNKYIYALFIGLAMVIILLPYFLIEINKDKSPKIKKPEIKEVEFKPKENQEEIEITEKTEEKEEK